MLKPKLKFSLIAVLLTFLLLASLPAISVFSQRSPIIRGVNGNTAVVFSPGRPTHELRTIAESVQYQLLKQTATIHPDGRGGLYT